MEKYKIAVTQKLFSQKLRFKDETHKSFPPWHEQEVRKILIRYSDPVKVESERSYSQIGIKSHGKGIFHKEPVSGTALGNKRVFWKESRTGHRADDCHGRRTGAGMLDFEAAGEFGFISAESWCWCEVRRMSNVEAGVVSSENL